MPENHFQSKLNHLHTTMINPNNYLHGYCLCEFGQSQMLIDNEIEKEESL